MSGTVLPWYKAPYKRSTVTTRESQEATIREAIAYWDARGRSFSQYDNNGDGRIDYIIVVWTGDHGEWGGLWWPRFTCRTPHRSTARPSPPTPHRRCPVASRVLLA